MDLVRDAGVDVSAWAVKQDGTAVRNPAANPAYCYEWAFYESGDPIALCVWHNDIEVVDGRIVYQDNLRKFATDLDAVGFDPRSPNDVRSRARTQAKRGRSFDSAIQKALFNAKPVRVIFLVGDPAAPDKLGWETSEVRYRSLDPEQWIVESYDQATGDFRLVRGAIPVPLIEEKRFVDQFTAPAPVVRVSVQGSVPVRSPEVRDTVLKRALGLCEMCGETGFTTSTGAIYLETHHVIPLSEQGPDVEWNVVGICSDDHKRAHFAIDRDELRNQLVRILLNKYPDARDAFISLGVNASDIS